MTQFQSIKKTVSWTTPVEGTPNDIFPLLCPVREYDWISDWGCTMVRSDSGFNELHCVFETSFDPIGKETWITVRYEPNARIEFVRHGDNWLVHYIIALAQTESGTNITWTMHMVGLTATGNEHVTGMTNEQFSGIMQRLGTSLQHYLTHGECLQLPTR